MKLFSTFIVTLILLISSVTGVKAQGVPVIDAMSVANGIEQIVWWGKQLDAMKNQIENQQRLYSSMNGARGFGRLLNDPALRDYIPGNWQGVYEQIQSGGFNGLTGAARAIRNANAIYECGGKVGPALKLCERELAKAAQDKAYAQQAYDSAKTRIDQIQGLIEQIDSTTDSKTIQELNARIAGENAMLQNEQTKLTLFKMLSEAEEKLISQQKRETSMKDAAKRGSVSSGMTPLSFR